MPAYPPLYPGQTFQVYGRSVTWTSQHYTPAELSPLLYSSDSLADECLARLDALTPSIPPSPSKGYLSLLLSNPEDPLLTSVLTLPPWVSLPQLVRAQSILYLHLPAFLTSLTFQSLLGGAAAPRISSVLLQTNGFSPNTTRRRLLQTFQHVLDITSSPEALLPPHGEAFISTLRVRLLHASVRRRILSKSRSASGRTKSGPGDEDNNDDSNDPRIPPISTLHSLATILSFSVAITEMSLPRQGIFLTPQERSDWLALWRYVAHLLGCDHACLASVALASAMLESIVVSELGPSDDSRRVARNMIAGLSMTSPTYSSEAFLRAQARWLNGAELADGLGIKWDGWYYDGAVAGQCIVLMGVSLFGRLMPGRWWEGLVRKGVGRMMINEGVGARGGETWERKGYVTDWWGWKGEGGETGEEGKAWRGKLIEWRNLTVLFLTIAGSGKLVWKGVGIVSQILEVLA